MSNLAPIVINANPHMGQKEVHQHPARFKVLAAGRRWGKTRLGVNECIDVATKGGRAWWVSPSYKTSEVGWRPLRQISRKIPGAEIKLADRTVNFPSGGFVSVRSADNPDSLRGEGLDFVVMDEAAFMQKEAWTEAIRPALSDRHGKALFISTPKGRNWYWENYMRGVNGEEGWASFTYPTTTNPYIDPKEVEAARRDLPEMIFLQEYMAEFIDDSGGVFRRINEAAVLEPLDEPLPGHTYVAGVDVASAIDFTVVTVMDAQTREMVFLDRFNRVDYPTLEDRLHAAYNRFNLTSMVIEVNSVGQGVIDHLAGRYMSITPFMTTNVTKAAIIQGLQAAFEHGNIKVINNPILVGELLSFESRKTPSGNYQYSAPEGMHDDCVMSLAMAYFGIDNSAWLIS